MQKEFIVGMRVSDSMVFVGDGPKHNPESLTIVLDESQAKVFQAAVDSGTYGEELWTTETARSAVDWIRSIEDNSSVLADMSSIQFKEVSRV